jgi:hypothetical protein
MATQFEDLRQRLDAKERELMQRLDDQSVKQQNEVEQYIRLIKGRSANLQETENHI